MVDVGMGFSEGVADLLPPLPFGPVPLDVSRLSTLLTQSLQLDKRILLRKHLLINHVCLCVTLPVSEPYRSTGLTVFVKQPQPKHYAMG